MALDVVQRPLNKLLVFRDSLGSVFGDAAGQYGRNRPAEAEEEAVHGSRQAEFLFRLGPRHKRLGCLALNRLIEFSQVFQVFHPPVESSEAVVESAERELGLGWQAPRSFDDVTHQSLG